MTQKQTADLSSLRLLFLPFQEVEVMLLSKKESKLSLKAKRK